MCFNNPTECIYCEVWFFDSWDLGGLWQLFLFSQLMSGINLWHFSVICMRVMIVFVLKNHSWTMGKPLCCGITWQCPWWSGKETPGEFKEVDIYQLAKVLEHPKHRYVCLGPLPGSQPRLQPSVHLVPAWRHQSLAGLVFMFKFADAATIPDNA